MALGPCQECSAVISDQATMCPGCGSPDPVRPVGGRPPVLTPKQAKKAVKSEQARAARSRRAAEVEERRRADPEEFRKDQRRAAIAMAVILTPIAAIVIAGALDGSDEAKSLAKPVASPSPSGTWETPYSETTCRQWQSQMSPRQRQVAAEDMLDAARRSDDEDASDPSPALATVFGRGISEACTEPAVASRPISEMAAALYVIGQRQFGP